MKKMLAKLKMRFIHLKNRIINFIRCVIDEIKMQLHKAVAWLIHQANRVYKTGKVYGRIAWENLKVWSVQAYEITKKYTLLAIDAFHRGFVRFLEWIASYRTEPDPFLADSNIQTLSRPHLFSHLILWTAVIVIFVGLIWAKFAILDEVTTGAGKVIPSSQVQVIQNLEGGIVSSIEVKEGDIVDKGQVLMQIDDTRFSAKYKEAKAKAIDLKIKIARLRAETENKPLDLPEELQKANPQQAKNATRLFESTMRELKQMRRAKTLAEKELNLSKPLVAKGAVSEVEVLRLERNVNDLDVKLSSFMSTSLKELNKAEAELAGLQESIIADEDRLSRTTVRSPVKGIIKLIKVNTIGGVVQPGMDIIEIVPLDDTLLIEAKVRPADIGFLHPKQNATVKISAYDFSIYGGLQATVEQISADTITDEKDDPFYIIRVRTNKNYLGTQADPLYIIPGMHATVDVLTGEKSVLTYLLKPILKAREKALRER